MPKGGYKIIDFKRANFVGDQNTHTIPGTYEAIKSAGGKPILVENFSISGVEELPFFSSVAATANNFYLYYRTSNDGATEFQVKNNDEVKFLSQKNGTAADGPVSDEDGPSASM